MDTPEPGAPLFESGLVRRLIHVVILIGLVVGVRECGGAASVEDQLRVSTRWIAERTGLGAVRERWDKLIRQPIAAITGSASDSLYRGMSRTLDKTEAVMNEGVTWLSAGVDMVADVLRAVFFPADEPPPPQPAPQPPPQPQSAPTPPQRKPA